VLSVRNSCRSHYPQIKVEQQASERASGELCRSALWSTTVYERTLLAPYAIKAVLKSRDCSHAAVEAFEIGKGRDELP
jgi:hypothetical protein